jgi:hypothetical protein
MKLKPIFAWIVIALFLGLLRVEACPVCFQSGGEERWAFYITTAFLTFLPLSMVGGVVYWLRKRFKQLEKDTP